MKITDIEWKYGKKYIASYEDYKEIYFVAENESDLISEETGETIDHEYYTIQIASMEFEEVEDEKYFDRFE